MKERDAGFGSEAGFVVPFRSPSDSFRDHIYYKIWSDQYGNLVAYIIHAVF